MNHDDEVTSAAGRFHRARERALLSLIAEGVVTADAKGVIQSINPAAERMFGYPPNEVLGENVSMLMPSPFAEQHDSYMQRYQETGERRIIGIGRDVMGLRKDGKVFPLHLSVSEIKVDQDVVYVGVLRDLTESTEVRRLAADNLSLEGSLSARQQQEESLQAALREKEILLKEVHHRVKNNLQLILSLISLRRRRSKGLSADVVIEEVRARIHSIALLHEMLYRGPDLVHINSADYLLLLTQKLLRDFGGGDSVTLSVTADSVALDIDRAIPCGLIVSELVTNCLKYAFAGRRNGHVEVRLQALEGDRALLSVADDGHGFPATLDLQHSPSLGLELVRKLAEKLAGTVQFSSDNGARISIEFPYRNRPNDAH